MTQRRLDGWKAIAIHMNRSVRQCQRLAESSGLPVHHLPASRAVFAYEHEVDAWISGGELLEPEDLEARLTTSGRHVVLPVDLARPPQEAGEGEASSAASRPRISGFRRAATATGLAIFGFLLLALGLHFRATSGWRNLGTPLTGTWTFEGTGVVGKAGSVARFDTGRLAAPGTAVTVLLSSCGTRWSGGLEIFEDDLHWTFVTISPREHEVVVQRFPAGTVTTFFMGQTIEPARSVKLHLDIGDRFLRLGCSGRDLQVLELAKWDVNGGRLMLRVGSPGDELHEPSSGTCSFKKLKLTGEPRSIPSPTVREVPQGERSTASYRLSADNIDDQMDVSIDGRRLASAGYREEIGPLDIGRYLRPGRHTITARVFNRKWTAAYGIRLTENDTVLWDESCGDVRKIHSGCQEIGDRLGMVKSLGITFTAR